MSTDMTHDAPPAEALRDEAGPASRPEPQAPAEPTAKTTTETPAPAEATAPAPPRSALAAEDWSFSAWLGLFRDLYFRIDRRTLGFSRILLGFLLLMDLLHRKAAWQDMYSSVGVLPTPLNLQRPQAWGAFSIFNAFTTPGEVSALWVLMVVNAVCLLVGYRTKVAQIMALVLHVGMNGRVLLIENGGYVVNNLLILWTMFLPMGDRFSVDAMAASMKRRRETTAADLNDRSDMLAPGAGELYTSLICFVLMIQISAIYYFNVIHKTGPAWRNGTAVHFVLYVDRMATPIVSVIRDHIPNPLIIFMTRSAMAFEAAIGVVLLQPLARAWARRAVIVMMCTLHLAFGITFVLGPFAWSACVFATLLFSRDDWEIAIATMRRPRRARTVLFDPRSGGALLACRILKRIDRFELLTFAPREDLPLGIGIEGQKSRADMLADIVEALPLGPAVAWIPRLPVVRGVVEAALHAVEVRDVSGFFGLRVEGRQGTATAPAAEAEAPSPSVVFIGSGLLAAAAVVLAFYVGRPLPGVSIVAVVVGLRILVAKPRAHAVMGCVSVLLVAGAVWLAVYRDEPLSGVLLVLGTVVAAALISTWVLFPVVTTRTLRRTAFGSLREALILALFAGAVNQALTELWCFNRRFKTPQPETLRLLSHKMRFLQGWFMFSPNPVTDDGTIVVDALTVDGRHIDPFTAREPNWDLNSKSLGLTQIWCDYFNRIQLPANTAYREAMKDYMYRLPQRTGRPEDAIVSGEVFWVKSMNPRWNDTKSYNYERAKLFSFENPAAQPRASR
jgi:hypothetical protein